MPKNGRKKRIRCAITISVICIAAIASTFFIFFNNQASTNRKSFDMAKLYLEYYHDISLESKNIFTYKNPDDSGMQNLTIDLIMTSLKAPMSGKLDLLINDQNSREIDLSVDFVVDEEQQVYFKIENTQNFLTGLNYVDFFNNILNQETINAIRESNEDWILINDTDSEFITEILLGDDANNEETVTCLDNFLNKYDQTTTKYITSTIDDEIEKYVFYTSNDKIERLANDFKSCFSNEQTKFFIVKIVELIENFSGLKAELNDDSQLTKLSVNNELDDYFFDSETTFKYEPITSYEGSPESYVNFDDLFKIEN